MKRTGKSARRQFNFNVTYETYDSLKELSVLKDLTMADIGRYSIEKTLNMNPENIKVPKRI